MTDNLLQPKGFQPSASSAKRPKEDDEIETGSTPLATTTSSSTTTLDPAAAALALKKAKSAKTARRDCPYLSTVNRNVLDFDFERVCSITLSDQNIYVCLVCGKFFQGRGKGTCAYRHALEQEHYVFMHLETAVAYCLPDDYEIADASLNDIKFNLKPHYTKAEVLRMSKGELAEGETYHSKSLDGTDFIPGCIGMNNIKSSDYLNVIVQMLCVVTPIRNALLEYEPPETKADPVVSTLSALIKKIFNKKNFKGIVSPHELFQAVGKASGKKFYGEQHDPVALLSWLVGYMRKRMKIFAPTFEGEIGMKAAPVDPGKTGGENKTVDRKWVDTQHKAIFFQLDVPAAPLFKDDYSFIPQVPLFTLLDKYNGETMHESIKKGSEGREVRKFTLRRLPPYVIFQIRRFQHNGYFIEKNPTIVNFPLKDLDLASYLHPCAAAANPVTKFNLAASIVHAGKPKGGEYKIHSFHRGLQVWHEVQDLRVTEVLPQQVALAEAYLLVYERQDVETDGSFETYNDVEIPDEPPAEDETEVDLEAMGIQIS